VLLCCFVNAEAQIINPPQSAFAIVTSEFGSTDGLFAVESLFNGSFFGLQQTNTSTAPLLSAASFNVNLSSADDTGIAIVNPTATVANVGLSVTNDQGIVVLSQTVAILPRGQFTRFLSELFGINRIGNSAALMTIVADVPVGIQPISFREGSFAATPVFSSTS